MNSQIIRFKHVRPFFDFRSDGSADIAPMLHILEVIGTQVTTQDI